MPAKNLAKAIWTTTKQHFSSALSTKKQKVQRNF